MTWLATVDQHLVPWSLVQKWWWIQCHWRLPNSGPKSTTLLTILSPFCEGCGMFMMFLLGSSDELGDGIPFIHLLDAVAMRSIFRVKISGGFPTVPWIPGTKGKVGTPPTLPNSQAVPLCRLHRSVKEWRCCWRSKRPRPLWLGMLRWSDSSRQVENSDTFDRN